ncbi:hypothetical protein EVAR_82905_1 [Eumeta japonica]|uniref:Uncharacterized protein n=1 Tax=Eumeta variegata TaxID=151549 RepID=A0A4C1X4B6_EUMVA|nr:hypothetical protein EVAR_82905_1 [Eumeta japonica]
MELKWTSVCRSSATSMVAGAGEEITVATSPCVFSSGIRPRRIQVIVTPWQGSVSCSPISHSAALALRRGVLKSSLGRFGSSATSCALVQYSGGIHRGPGWRCHTSSEQCAE